MQRVNSPIAKDNSPIAHFGGGRDDNVVDSNSPMRGNNSPTDNEDVAKNLVKQGNHSVFNSPITKGNSPITPLGGGRDDNDTDSNSPMRGTNSSTDRKEQGTAHILVLLLVCSCKVRKYWYLRV